MINNRAMITAASIACFMGCIGDFWFTYILADYKPGYSHLLHTMSMLGVSESPVSVIISTWWIVLGFLLIFFAIGFSRAFGYHNRAVKIATWLIILYGLGEGLGSALFKAERVNKILTLAGQVHEVMGAIGTIAMLLLPLVMMKIIHRSSNPRFHTLSLVVFITAIIFLILFVFRFTSYHIDGLFLYQGLWQRLFILDYYIYLTIIAVIMIKRQQNPFKTA